MKSILKNRTSLGILSIFLALVISFGITPMLNRKSLEEIEIIRASKRIKESQIISQDMISKVKVGKKNLPKDILVDENEIIGKFAKGNIYEGDFFFKEKITDIEKTKDYYLNNSYNKNFSISITLKSFASGLSAKLEEGDIVTPLVRLGEEDPYLIDEINYIKVLANTTEKGLDKEEAEDGEIPSTVTLSVNEIQAQILAKYELDGDIHLALAYRGEEDNAKRYLDLQNKYFEMNYKGGDE